MSKLRKNRYIQIILSLLIFHGSLAVAQSRQELVSLYEKGEVEKLHDIQSRGLQYPGWQQFLQAIFEPEAAAAVEMMAEAYGKTSDSQLRTIIQERIALYYSAQGYYETARRIKEDPAFFRRLMSVKNVAVERETNRTQAAKPAATEAPESGYAVQAGAYSTRENAEKTRDRFAADFPTARVLTKEKNGSTLYIVAIGKGKDRSDAEAVAEKLMNRFKVKGYIIQY